ncbi:CHASE domain-containing protein [Gallaecimonas kandeliae]|uniref:CHASE domain-containing protein n=1 Tax=Gallaecimonas kandeliae TaxID=3029055 RepID=UPI0026488261|nr:CHASE domain-containing protein [Gallaecimonas kandeliae]WKE66327.1 CHASE domain-containing protein [Gallaecimonas kandeliae]
MPLLAPLKRLQNSRSQAALVFLGMLALTSYGLYSNSQRVKQEQELLLGRLARAQASAIERRINQSLSTTYALAQELQRKGGTLEDFPAFAKQLIASTGLVNNLQLAPQGVVTEIYPLAGNEPAIGFHIFDDRSRWNEAHLAVTRRSLALIGPFDLIQGGGMAVIGHYPVFLKSQEGERFWGFTSAVIMLADLVKVTELDRLEGQGYAYRLSRVRPDDGKKQVFSRSEAELGQPVVSENIHLPNATWTLSLGLVKTSPWRHGLFNLLLELAILSLASVLLVRILREPERLQQLAPWPFPHSTRSRLSG